MKKPAWIDEFMTFADEAYAERLRRKAFGE